MRSLLPTRTFIMLKTSRHNRTRFMPPSMVRLLSVITIMFLLSGCISTGQ